MFTTSRLPAYQTEILHRQQSTHESLKRPALMLLGAAAISLAMLPSGTLKPAESAAIATITTGGAIACLWMDRR